MQQVHHTLKKDLTKTIVLWSAGFFTLLGVVFLLSFHSLETYILDLMADHRLNYQVREFAKHLDEQDLRSIDEESNALVQAPSISGILMVDASGELLHIALSNGNEPELRLSEPLKLANLKQLIEQHGGLHLYMREIPGHSSSLALVMDDRPIEAAILTTVAWTSLVMLMLVMLSIRALHYSLNKQLVEPVEHLRKAIEDDHLNAKDIRKLEDELPQEASEILEVFDHLKHSHDDLKIHIADLMEALPACFWWSHDGRHYTGINGKSALVIHMPANELHEQPLWRWCESEAQSRSNIKRLQQAIDKQRQRLDLAYQIQHGDQLHWYGETIIFCYDKQGKLETLYGIISDISSRKEKQRRLAEQLELANRMETTATLAGGIAHEFNNAMAGMNGNVFLLKQDTNDEKTLTRLNRIEQLIERSALMIDRMLAFACKSALQSDPIALIDFLKQFQVTLLPILPGHAQFNLQFDADMEADKACQPVIRADRKKLQEALMQLIQNAAQAVADVSMPRISISLGIMDANEKFLRTYPQLSSRQLAHLQVQDNGCGISGDIMEWIYDPFFTTREVGQGTGLGLSMVYGYVRQLGGCMYVESEAGHGSIFHIYLPRLVEPGQSRRQIDELLRGNGETILVIDDEAVFRQSACEVLNRLGYQPLEGRDGKHGIQMFEQHRDNISLVFMDIMMPGMNGIETSRRIRAIAPDIPIIFITAYDRSKTFEPEVYADHSELINKPFRISVLSQTIRKALQEKREA